MSTAGPVVDHSGVVDPVLPTAAVVAGFEVGMLLRCVRTGSGRHDHRVCPSSAVEVSRAAAAARLVSLLAVVGFPAHRDEYAAGGWHRYTVHRVVCPGLDDPLLAKAWCTGYRRLCGAHGYRSIRQRRHQRDLATAAWRAALLAGGLRNRGGPLAVRVNDAELAQILVRAARVLDIPATLRTAAGRHLVEVPAVAEDRAIRDLVAETAARTQARTQARAS